MLSLKPTGTALPGNQGTAGGIRIFQHTGNQLYNLGKATPPPQPGGCVSLTQASPPQGASQVPQAFGGRGRRGLLKAGRSGHSRAWRWGGLVTLLEHRPYQTCTFPVYKEMTQSDRGSLLPRLKAALVFLFPRKSE